MCLLFYNVNDSCKENEYQLILANNRDEMWNRPTKTSHFWESCQNLNCIGGRYINFGTGTGTGGLTVE